MIIPLLKNKFWMQKRIDTKNIFLDGLLEFAGGKIEIGETAKCAAIREFYEEVNISLKEVSLNLFGVYDWKYKEMEFDLNFSVFTLNVEQKDLDLFKDKNGFWIHFSEINKLENQIPKANGPIILDLIQKLGIN